MIRGLSNLITSGRFPIKRGFTFKALLPDGSSKQHYCIIINKKVTKNTTVYYFYMTSQKEKVIRIMRYDKGALVSINNRDYSILTKETFIQCDKRHLRTIEYDTLIEGLSSGLFQKVDDVSNSIIDKILSAINSSKTYSEEDKKELTG
jgi:hypothetical protein